MASQFNNTALRPATARSSDSISTQSTTILNSPGGLETADKELEKEQRCISPHLMITRPSNTPPLVTPLPSPLKPLSASSNYGPSGPPPAGPPPPVPLKSSLRKRSNFTTQEHVSQPQATGRLTAPDKPESRQNRYPFLAPKVRVKSSDDISRYQFQQRQPDPAQLPPATKLPLHAKRLHTHEDKEASKVHRSELLGISEHIRKIGTVGDYSQDENGNIEKLPTAFHETNLQGRTTDSEDHIIVLSIRTKKFRRVPRSSIFTNPNKLTMVSELPNDVQCSAALPPLLVDGRMIIDEIPKWKRSMQIVWRSWNGNRARLKRTKVKIPIWLWLLRNIGEARDVKELVVFIERGEQEEVKEKRKKQAKEVGFYVERRGGGEKVIK